MACPFYTCFPDDCLEMCVFIKSWCSIYGLSYVSFQSDDEDLDDDSDDDMSEDEETPKKVLMSN